MTCCRGLKGHLALQVRGTDNIQRMPKKYYMFSGMWKDLALGVCKDTGQ